MEAAELRRWCLAQSGAVEDFPFGPEHSVFKVGGKMFALSTLERTPLAVSAKCEPEHWNTITLDGSLSDQLVRELIADSYDLVVSALPKRTREELGWAPEADL